MIAAQTRRTNTVSKFRVTSSLKLKPKKVSRYNHYLNVKVIYDGKLYDAIYDNDRALHKLICGSDVHYMTTTQFVTKTKRVNFR